MAEPMLFLNGRVTLYPGDCLDVLAGLPEASVDSIVTDPPYGLEFMGKGWDKGVPGIDYWRQVFRVLKPGGYLLAFGGTRTYHRMVCAIEDAGFEIRDQIQWLYGSGFPKSLDISKAIDKAAGAEREKIATGAPVKRMIPGADQNKAGWEKNNGREYVPGIEIAATPEAAAWEGWGTALKPAHEPIVLARKPIEGTNAENVLKHGVGGLNIDGCRVPTDETIKATRNVALGSSSGGVYGAANKPGIYEQKEQGRWPANVIHDGSTEVIEAFPEQVSGGTPASRAADKFRTTYGAFKGAPVETGIGPTSGSAARFFYSAKADSDDRIGSKHPTIKPVDLMRYLCRLVTPPKGTVLDIFAGTGTTGEAAFYEGFNAILVEQEPEYQADIARRMALVLAGPEERKRALIAEKTKGEAADMGPLFAGIAE